MLAAQRLAQDGALARLAMGVAGYATGVDLEKIARMGRGPSQAAFARQIAMYLCHVGMEMSLSRVATAFGRDRSTVAHACHRVEDRRDDLAFDAWVGALEVMLRAAPAPGRSGPPVWEMRA